MSQVTRLQPRERPRHDGEAIAVLYRNLGTPTAERMVSRALDELSLAMTRAAGHMHGHRLGELEFELARVVGLAGNLGMESMAQVARDACICLERGDGGAFSAVWARLSRITRQSLDLGTSPPDSSG